MFIKYFLVFLCLSLGSGSVFAQRMIIRTKSGTLKEYGTNRNTKISFSMDSVATLGIKIFKPQFKQFITTSKIAFKLKLSPHEYYKFKLYNIQGRQIFSNDGFVGNSGVLNFSLNKQLSHGVLIMCLESRELSFSRKLIMLK